MNIQALKKRKQSKAQSIPKRAERAIIDCESIPEYQDSPDPIKTIPAPSSKAKFGPRQPKTAVLAVIPQKRDWIGLRAEYEQSGKACTLRYLAKRHGIPENTVFQRSMREKWKKQALMVGKAFKEIETIVEDKVQKRIRDQIAPWIEKQKASFVKQSFVVAKNGIKRTAIYQKSNPKVEARDEANIAKAFEGYTRTGRTILGLDNGQSITGNVQLNVLTNRSAIQLVQSDVTSARR